MCHNAPLFFLVKDLKNHCIAVATGLFFRLFRRKKNKYYGTTYLVLFTKLTEEVKSTWFDKNEATEYTATAIAMLLILKLTKFDVFRRTRGGTDYVLANSKKKPDICYLEISGIWKERKQSQYTEYEN